LDAGGNRSLELSLAAGFTIAEMGSDRLRGQTRYSTPPLPAALTLTELYEALRAAADCFGVAAQAWGTAHRDVDAPEAVELQLAMSAQGGLGLAVNLSQFSKRGNLSVVQHEVTYPVQSGTSIAEFLPAPGDLAVAAIRGWTDELGYGQDVAIELEQIWRRR